MMQKNTRRGFTLIELLVVVLIIGILAAVAVPQYQKAVSKARITEAIVSVRNLGTAEISYYLANGNYTDDLDLLDISLPNTTGKYFTYSCFEDNYPSCLAKPTKEGLPVLEYKFSTNRNGNEYKLWCQAHDTPMSQQAKEQALALCRTLGTRDTSITAKEIYLIN